MAEPEEGELLKRLEAAEKKIAELTEKVSAFSEAATLARKLAKMWNVK